MKLPPDLVRREPDRLVAVMLQGSKDEWSDTVTLSAFLKETCRLHPAGCGGHATHRDEMQVHEDAYVEGFRDAFGPAADFTREFRREPGVAKGSLAGRHVVYWKLNMNGLTFRSGRVKDLAEWDDYDPVSAARF